MASARGGSGGAVRVPHDVAQTAVTGIDGCAFAGLPVGIQIGRTVEDVGDDIACAQQSHGIVVGGRAFYQMSHDSAP